MSTQSKGTVGVGICIVVVSQMGSAAKNFRAQKNFKVRLNTELKF
jgi:hypothetical protein